MVGVLEEEKRVCSHCGESIDDLIWAKFKDHDQHMYYDRSVGPVLEGHNHAWYALKSCDGKRVFT